MIETYKILHGVNDTAISPVLSVCQDPAKTLASGLRWANVSATMNNYKTLGQRTPECVAQQTLFPHFTNRPLRPITYNRPDLYFLTIGFSSMVP